MNLLLPSACFFFPFVREPRVRHTYKIRSRFPTRLLLQGRVTLFFLLFSCEHKSLFTLRTTAFFSTPTMHARVHAAGLLSSKSFVARHYVQRGGSNRRKETYPCRAFVADEGTRRNRIEIHAIR